ncbi:MAG: outer membrane protein transport protein [Gammaproteobacteria bacterium]|nr:outer membrane protein transport protein [Gammaproteobacteria bacterium]
MANDRAVTRCLRTCGVAGLLAVSSNTVFASSFALIEQSVSGMGSAYAIGSAGIDDASTIFFNPATMTRLSGSNLTGGLQIVNSRTDFKGSAEYNPNNAATATPPPYGLGIAGYPISGDAKSNLDLTAGIPMGAISHQLNDRVWLGLTINAPYGLKTDYDDDWVGRYHAIKSELYTYNFNPTLAFKINDHATIGVGVSAMYADGELTQAVDGGLVSALAGAPIPGWIPGSSTYDGKAKLTGNDWGFGFNVGFMLEPSDNTRLGLHYRSGIDLTLDGDSKVSGLTGAVSALNGKQDAKLDIGLPDTLSISGYHAINSKWAFMADYTWTQWSRIKSLDIKLENGSKSVAKWNYDDSSRFSIGTEYTQNNKWKYRAGLALDQTPVPHDSERSPRVPDADRTWLSLGLTYTHSPSLSFDLGYAHLFVDDPKLDDVSDNNDPTLQYPVGLTGFHTLSGSYDAAVDIFGAQVNWRFN